MVLAFLAALGWFTLAVVSLLFSILAMVLIVTIVEAAAIILLGALVPFLIGRGIIQRSGTAAGVGFLYGLLGASYYVVNGSGGSAGALYLVVLAGVSALAAREIRRAQDSPIV